MLYEGSLIKLRNSKFPQVLGLSVERNLRPTVSYLTHELGVQHSDLQRILTSMPQLLGLSVEGNLKVKVLSLLALLVQKCKY